MAEKKSDQETAKEGGMDDTLWQELQQEMAKLPPETVAKAKQEMESFLTGEATWLEMFDYPPEKLHQIAQHGYQLFQIGRYDKAEVLFKGLTILDPQNHYYHSVLGAIYQRQQKWAESVVEYSVALELKPGDVVSRTNRGEVYLKLHMLEQAEQDFRDAIALDKEGSDKWANRARMLLKKVKLALGK